MPIRRVAVIFDDRTRPDTTGVYLRRALAQLVDVVHFRPEEAATIPQAGFDLYLSIDDDTEHRLPPSLQPRAYWAIDTHLDFPARLRRAAERDTVFAAQESKSVSQNQWLFRFPSGRDGVRYHEGGSYDVSRRR